MWNPQRKAAAQLDENPTTQEFFGHSDQCGNPHLPVVKRAYCRKNGANAFPNNPWKSAIQPEKTAKHAPSTQVDSSFAGPPNGMLTELIRQLRKRSDIAFAAKYKMTLQSPCTTRGRWQETSPTRGLLHMRPTGAVVKTDFCILYFPVTRFSTSSAVEGRAAVNFTSLPSLST